MYRTVSMICVNVNLFLHYFQSQCKFRCIHLPCLLYTCGFLFFLLTRYVSISHMSKLCHMNRAQECRHQHVYLKIFKCFNVHLEEDKIYLFIQFCQKIQILELSPLWPHFLVFEAMWFLRLLPWEALPEWCWSPQLGY